MGHQPLKWLRCDVPCSAPSHRAPTRGSVVCDHQLYATYRRSLFDINGRGAVMRGP